MAEFVTGHLDELLEKEPAPGVFMRAFAGTGLSVASVRLAPDTTVAAHRHIAEQVGIVLEGSMEITAGGKTELVKAGSVYVIDSDVPHAVRVGPNGCRVVEMFAPARDGVQRLS